MPVGSLDCPKDVLHPIFSSPAAIDFSAVHGIIPFADVYHGKTSRQTKIRKIREKSVVCRRLGWPFASFVVEAGNGHLKERHGI